MNSWAPTPPQTLCSLICGMFGAYFFDKVIGARDATRKSSPGRNSSREIVGQRVTMNYEEIRPKRVLVVEDSALAAHSLRLALGMQNYMAHVACDGAQALSM